MQGMDECSGTCGVEEGCSQMKAKPFTTLEKVHQQRIRVARDIAGLQSWLARLDDVIETVQTKPDLLTAYETVNDVLNNCH
jgi:hypothetical protein